MLNLAWPWMLVVLPLPLLVRWLMVPADNSAPALRSRLLTRFAGTGQSTRPLKGSGTALVLLSLIWLGVVAAATRPQWVGEPVAMPSSGRDLLLAVDISESMLIEDMESQGESYPRLAAVKQVVGDFVERRRGDRLGLILFGTRAYLQTPLTFDRATLNTLLGEAKVGFAGKATAIGDAIGIAIKRLKEHPADSRVLILLSDGADTASELPPRKAAELAAEERIRIYTVGIGAEAVVRRSFFGTRTLNPSADLDEELLSYIANTTGGRYFRARDPEELAAIYSTLDKLEPIEQKEETVRPTKSLFQWPLAIALAAFLVLAAVKFREVRHG